MTVDLRDRIVVDIAEAAELCGVSAHTIRRAIAAGLPTTRATPAGRPLISRRVLDEWFASGGALQASIDAHPAGGAITQGRIRR